MQTIVNKQIVILLVLFFLLFSAGRLYSQETGTVRITNLSSAVSDDSLRVRFTLTANDLKIGNRESLTLLPRITDGKFSVSLPTVVYTGKFRQKYDERKHIFSQETQLPVFQSYSGVRENKEYRLHYESAVPYSSRLQSGKLLIEYRYDDCCSSYPTSRIESYALEFAAPKPVVESPAVQTPTEIRPQPQTRPQTRPTAIRENRAVQEAPEPAYQPQTRPAAVRENRLDEWEEERTARTPYPAKTKTKKEIFFLEYPLAEFHIIRDYGRNDMELNKLDRLLEGYHGAIWVTAYASPDGPYDNNEMLAMNRAEGLKIYLSQHYAINSVSTEYVAEDWDGLRKLIKESDIPGKMEALDIIDRVSIFSGREKMLMELRGGDFWKKISPFFRQLRRVEVEIMD